MIFLSDNALMERDLTFDDIKPRLLGMLFVEHHFEILLYTGTVLIH